MTHKCQSTEVTWLAKASMPMIRVKPGAEFAVMPTGRPRSLMMHYSQELKRTQPCLLVSCPHCREGQPRRPLSYLPVMHFRFHGEGYQWLPAILEVPHSTGLTLNGLVNQIVAVKRERAFGPVLVGKYLWREKKPKPIPFEVLDHLMPLWRLNRGTALVLVGDVVGRHPRPAGLDDELWERNDEWCVSPGTGSEGPTR